MLAPIVAAARGLRVPAETRAELERLAGRYALVACVTGRPSDVAREIVGVDGLRYVGEHGLELDPEAAAWADAIHAFAARRGLARQEEKPLTPRSTTGPRADRDAARRELEAVAAARARRRASARAGAGWCSRCCRRSTRRRAPRCGTCSTESGLTRALYAGDDTTDLDGFAALDGLEVAVRVAVVSAEGPASSARAPTSSSARPDAFLELLRAALAAQKPSRSRSWRDWRRATSSSVFAASASWRRSGPAPAAAPPATLPG